MKRLRFDVGLVLLSALLLLLDLAIIIVSEVDDGSAALLDDVSAMLDQASLLIEVLLFALVGIIITRRHPMHPVGVALLITGVGLGGFFAFEDYATVALRSPDSVLPWGSLAATLSSAVWPAILTGMFYLMLLFPSGSVQGRWLKLMGKAWPIIAMLVALPYFVVPDSLEPPFKDVQSPFAKDELAFLQVLFDPGAALLFLSAIIAFLNILIRFRQSRGAEREQFRWIALTAVFAIVGTVLTAFDGLYTIAAAIQFVGIAGFPVAVGVAIMRYRLYDIDRILNRTLVYGLLTIVLGGIYVASVIGLQEVLRPLNGGSDLAIVVTTLLVAALFLPARRALQTAVDRRFNRRHFDAARTIDAFSTRLRDQIDLDTLHYELLAVVDDTMQPSRASIWLRLEEHR